MSVYNIRVSNIFKVFAVIIAKYWVCGQKFGQALEVHELHNREKLLNVNKNRWCSDAYSV
jgi:hypothetical protein